MVHTLTYSFDNDQTGNTQTNGKIPERGYYPGRG